MGGIDRVGGTGTGIGGADGILVAGIADDIESIDDVGRSSDGSEAPVFSFSADFAWV